MNVAVFNLQGRLVETLHEDALPAGSHRFTWQAGSHASGVYFLVAQSGDIRSTQKVLLLK